MQMSWENGIAVGRALEQLRHHDVQLMKQDDRITVLEMGHESTERKIDTLREWVIRGALLVLLWTTVIAGGLTAEQAAEVAGTTLKNLIRK